jgi:two-component system LytT family sensor kinase
MARVLKGRLREYAAAFLVWTALGAFFFSQGLTQKFLSGEPTPWWHYLIAWFTGVYTSALLTPTVLWLGRKFRFERRNWPRRAALHLLFSLAFALIHVAVLSELLSRFGVFPSVMKGFTRTLIFLLMTGFHQNLVDYWLILGIQYALRYYRGYRERERQAVQLELRASELKAQLARAHLSSLKMQLQPHFLFNTLNAIVVLVRQRKTGQAEEMLARLSDLLRCVLEDVEAHEVPLRRELEYLRLYLSIEQVRFQDRLRIDVAAEPEVLDAAFPHMGLQPIVENAIRHGIGRSSAAGWIAVRAARVHDTLEVIVQDDGHGFPTNYSAAGPGIGLANMRARLRQLYGEAARLTAENGSRGGAVLTIVLPFRLVPDLTGPETMEVHALDSVDR